MEITITRSGGLAGKHQILGPVSTTHLVESAAIHRLVEAMCFFDVPPTIPSQDGKDLFTYVTTVDDVAGFNVARFNTVVSDDLSDQPYRNQLDQLIGLLLDSGVGFLEHAAGFDVDWDEVLVVPQTVSGFLVILRGETPLPTFISLEPEDTQQFLDYAPVHVVGRTPDLGPDVVTPWEKQIPLDRLPAGAKGTVLIGATKKEFIAAQVNVTAS